MRRNWSRTWCRWLSPPPPCSGCFRTYSKNGCRSATCRQSSGIAEAALHTSSVQALVEQVRVRLAKQLCWANRGEDGALPIVTMGPNWVQAFNDALVGPGNDKQLTLAHLRLREFIKSVREAFERAALAGDAAVLLTSPAIRPYVRSIIERFCGQTMVIS